MENSMILDVEKLKKLREGRGWSQEQLAHAAGLSVRTVQRAERDGTASRETKVCLAAALDVPHGDLGAPACQDSGTVRVASKLNVSELVHTTLGTTFLMVGLGLLGASAMSGLDSMGAYIGGFFAICGVVDLVLARASRRSARKGAHSVA